MPFCPECRRSYETGVVLCRDCQSHLVDELPKAAGWDESGYVLLREVPDSVTAAMWLGALESQGLHPVVQSNALPAYGNVLRDWSAQTWGALVVPSSEYEEAQVVLDDFLSTAASKAPGEDEDPEATS
jgi:hypothetical protein